MRHIFIGAFIGTLLAWLLPTWLTVVLAIGGILWIIKGIEA